VNGKKISAKIYELDEGLRLRRRAPRVNIVAALDCYLNLSVEQIDIVQNGLKAADRETSYSKIQ
jgi:hypothetical protein